jgi:hypothetical protein
MPGAPLVPFPAESERGRQQMHAGNRAIESAFQARFSPYLICSTPAWACSPLAIRVNHAMRQTLLPTCPALPSA